MADNAFADSFSLVRKILWNVLFVISYPIITSFSLLFMGIIWFFSTLSRLLNRIGKGENSFIELKKPTWKPLINVGNFQIEKLFVDDILFGPTYYSFRSTPEIIDFKNVYFGDFVYKCFDGVLLQKWNSTTFKDLPDFTLVFLDGKTGNIIEIEKIKSFSWVANQIDENKVVIKWFNGTEGGEVLIKKEDLQLG